jgi:ankyrin repeat protein
MVSLLLDKESDVTRVDMKGRTPLLHACLNNNIKLCKILLAEGANTTLYSCRKKDISILSISIVKNYLDIFNLFLEKVDDINMIIENESNYTMIHNAVARNNLEIANILINNGANVNVNDNCRITPLHLSTSEEMTTLLLNNNANVNEIDTRGKSPLLICCENSKKHLIKLLLDHGADMNCKDKDRNSPLYLSIKRIFLDIFNIFIEKIDNNDINMNIHKDDNIEKTMLQVAIENNCLSIVNILIDRGVNINVVDDKIGNSPLHSIMVIGK